MNDVGLSLRGFAGLRCRRAVIFAEEAGEEEEEFAADDLVAVHVANVLELGLSRLVDRGIVAYRQNPQLAT